MTSYSKSGRDIQNLIRFLYTGKTLLNEKEFEVFQQLVYEFQISTEENTAIILEEISKGGLIEQEHQVKFSVSAKGVCTVNLRLKYSYRNLWKVRK